MNQANQTKINQEEKAAEETSGKPSRHSEYLYRTAGVRERSGYIPFWLILVTAGLLIWAVYYLQNNWTPAG